MTVIFGFSSRDAEESTIQSNSVTEFLIMLLEDDSDMLTDERKVELVEKYDGFVRKTAHFCVFGVFGFLMYFTLGSLVWIPNFPIRPSYISLPFCVLFAITDEYHQIFVPGRSCQIKDIIIDSVGALCGTMAGALMVILVKKLLKHRKNS